MIRIRGKHHTFHTSIPALDNQRISFFNYEADVSEQAADWLIRHKPDQYSVVQKLEVNTSSRVLVIRNMGLGDVLLATAAVRKLKQSGVQSIDFATERVYIPLFDGNPYVDRVIALEDVNRSEYQGVVDLTYYVEHKENSGQHLNRSLAFIKAMGLQADESDIHLDYYIAQEEKDWAQKELYERHARIAGRLLARRGRLCAFIWRSSTENRNWTKQKNLEVLKALDQAGITPVILDHEIQQFGAVNHPYFDATGKYDIRQSIALLDACDVVITPDSGFFHAASALDKKVLAYFGAFPWEERYTHTNLRVLQCDAHCKPCRQYWCFNKVDGVSRCINNSTEQIVGEALRFLSKAV